MVVGELEWRSVPVVADSRSEELTDGQETPFLPSSLPLLPTNRLGCPTKAVWALARATQQLAACVWTSTEHPLQPAPASKNRMRVAATIVLQKQQLTEKLSQEAPAPTVGLHLCGPQAPGIYIKQS